MASTVKVNPTYILDVQYPPTPSTTKSGLDGATKTIYAPVNKFIEFAYPLTVEFSIKKSISATLNTADFSIYNLNPVTRQQLAKDRYNQNDLGNGLLKRLVNFKAGYQKKLVTLFSGNLMEGWSERRGTEIITRLNCQDGGYEAYNKYTQATYNPPITFQDILKGLVQDMGIPIGWLSKPDNADPLRSITLSGNTNTLIQDNFGQNQSFIENGQFYFLKENEFLPVPILVISADTGLKGVPRRQDTIIEIEMIFEPTVILGQAVQLISAIDKRFNGIYKVVGYEHSGIISGAVDGERTTRMQLLIGSGLLGGLTQATAS